MADVQPEARAAVTVLEPIEGYDLTSPLSAMRRAEMAAGAFIAGYSSPRTREAFSLDLRTFFAYLGDIAPGIDPILEVRRGHVDTFMRSLEDRGLKPATVNRRVGTVCVFYRWLLAEEYIDRDPTANVKRPKVPRESSTEFLTRREAADFISEAEKLGGYPYALCCLLLFNGFRISSVLNANVEDLGTYKYHRTLHIVTKGNQPRTKVIPARTAAAIEDAIGDRTTGPLLLNEWDMRMKRVNAAAVIRKICVRARIARNLTPHGLRHTFVSSLLESGVPIDKVSQDADHVDISTTQRYDRRTRKMDAAGCHAMASFIAEVER